ncbi:bifunctional DNA primase/polymerase [Streptomyces sp. NPDC088354]|uniref:bifunctional DNA primase/polymerase n=1 Tax=Streptomyces sp. NPDC088354 TaxID=3365856 RepID=UPI003803B1D6
MPRHGEISAAGASPEDVAHWCANQNWPVHPLTPLRKTPPANCRNCGKDRAHAPETCACLREGRWCHSFHAATTDHELIRRWWSLEPNFGVAVSCGPADLVVIDVDAHAAQVPDRTRLLPGISIDARVNLSGLSSGYDTLALLAALRGQPNPVDDRTTLRVRTVSGGCHIWYRRTAEDPPYKSSTGSGKTALAWQVDVRSTGGYIIAPSTRTSTGRYERVGSATLPAPLPRWLGAELVRTGHVHAPPQPLSAPTRRRVTRNSRDRAWRALETLLAAVDACATIPEGAGFTEKLNRAAFTAGGFSQGGRISLDEACQLLIDAADRARPHQAARNRQIIKSALAAGARRPLHPEGRP